MQSSRNFKQIQSVALPDSVTSIDGCADYVAAGCLDDSVHIWNTSIDGEITKETEKSYSGNAMGIVDLAFNHHSTHLVTSCMDSTLRLFDLKSGQLTPITIECQVMMNWKVEFISNQIVTGGDSGKITYYSLQKEQVKVIQMGDTFLTALAQAQKESYIAAGNNNGDVIIHKYTESKEKKELSLKHHHKLVRELAFMANDTKLLTASDDASIKLIDLNSEKTAETFQGHRISVSSVDVSKVDINIFYSTSFDKTVKAWDLRTKSCVATMQADSPLWDCKAMGKNVYVGGESGKLNLYTLG